MPEKKQVKFQILSSNKYLLIEHRKNSFYTFKFVTVGQNIFQKKKKKKGKKKKRKRKNRKRKAKQLKFVFSFSVDL